MKPSIQHTVKVHFGRGTKSQKTVRLGPKPIVAAGRVPRVARLLALAHRFEKLVQTGVAADYADLARLGRVTRARVTQIMNLLGLAPDIQEQILYSPGGHEREGSNFGTAIEVRCHGVGLEKTARIVVQDQDFDLKSYRQRMLLMVPTFKLSTEFSSCVPQP